jgi:hypothetical protein
VSAAAALALACANFPVIDANVCGNRVIDANEDCDGFAEKGKVCLPPGTDNACHFGCAPGATGRPACPEGWGCNNDAVCRAPTTTFEPTGALDVGAWNLSAGDFDGDGRGDIMSSEPVDSVGATQLRFFYFDQAGALADTRTFPKLLLSPMVKDISQDGLSDVTFAYGQVSLMLGRKDRSWIPETFASYLLGNSKLRMIPVYTHVIEDASPIVPLADLPTGTGFFVPNAEGQLDPRARIPGKIADLVGAPVSANLFEDTADSPCLEPVYALRGAHHFTVMNTCERDADGVVLWRKPFGTVDVSLEPAAAIDAAPQIVDMNHDGHLDVLLGAGGRVYVAFGDGQRLAPAVPYRLVLANSDDGSLEIPMPLAVGDFSGDGAPDFVFADSLLVSVPSRTGGPPSYDASQSARLGSPYTTAIIADFNGNGFPDVVAGSSGSLDLEFFNGTGTPDLTKTRILTGNPVQYLSAGDYDGDLITDLALLEAAPAGESTNPVRIAFGAPFAPPSAPITVAHVSGPEQLMSYTQDGISSMVVASEEVVAGVVNGAFTFLDGTGDRLPYAALSLTDFASTGSTDASAALAVAVGSFSKAGQADLMALACPDIPANSMGPVISVPTLPWLVPNILGAAPVSQRLAGGLDGRLNPVAIISRNLSAHIASASADLNGDGRDEGIFAMPVGAQQDQCGVLVFSADRPGASALKARAPLVLNEPCTLAQLSAVNLTADGPPDLALLTGDVSGGARHLYVLWNDGAGGFDAQAMTLVSDAQDSPQAFTVLPGTAPNRSSYRALSLAYVTAHEVRYATLADAPRSFAPVVSVPEVPLSGGTGIAATDVNGDGVADLVVAESGKLLVLKAQLEAP